MPKRRHPGRHRPAPSRPAGGAYAERSGVSALPASSVYVPRTPPAPKPREAVPEALPERDRAYVIKELRRIAVVAGIILALLIVAAVLL